eukprot:g17904.t1
MLHDSGRAKRLALIICGSDPGKLDPGASLQAVSISPRSPRPAGPMTSSLGVQFRQTCTRHSSSSSSSGRIRGSNANVSAGTATTPTTLTTPTATTSASEHGGISKLDEIATDNCHRHTATVPRGRECTTLENRKWKCQQDQLNGNVSNRQESAKVGRQDPQVTAATECVQNARPVGAASRVLASTSPPEGAKTESYRCTRLRPSSAGLLYFRASLNRDGERVAATPREGRERHILGHDKAATCRLWSQGDKRAAPEPISQQSDATTTDKAGAVGDTPGLMVESVMAARRGLANRATGSGDFVFSKAASGEEGCAHDPNNTATPAGMIVDGKPSCLQVAISSGFLQSPRVEHGTEGTAGADILRVDGVGGNPRMWGSIPSEGLTRHQSPAEVDRGKTAAATAGKDPLLPCAGSGLPAASPGETMTTAVAAEAASGTCNEVERLHRHVSTLEMISAMAHVPASVPPDCVQGVEISIPAGKPRPASSPPRRILTRAGVDNCAIDDGRFNQEMPPLYKREKFRGNEGGTAKRVAAPCTSLLRRRRRSRRAQATVDDTIFQIRSSEEQRPASAIKHRSNPPPAQAGCHKPAPATKQAGVSAALDVVPSRRT